MPRPIQTWHGFAGQKEIVAALREHARGALRMHEPMLHCLLTGPSGIGKTRLAESLAKEMGTNCATFASSNKSQKIQVVDLLMKMKKADVLFIDEIHALPIDCQEMLFPAIDRQIVPLVDHEKRRLDESKTAEIQPFTLVAATDQPGKLRKALKQRIPLVFHLGAYSLAEMRVIVGNYAANLGLLMKPQAITRIANASRGIPRRARHLLTSLKVVMPDLTQEVSKTFIDRHLRSIGIDDENLAAMDLRYLEVVRDHAGKVSLSTLAHQLQVDTAAVLTDIEPYLMFRGFVGIESRGRYLTAAGLKLLNDRRAS